MRADVEVPQRARNMVKKALENGGYLVRKKGLNVDPKEKQTMNVDDFHDVMATLWQAPMERLYLQVESQREDLWLFEHLAAYTGTRPGALVDNTRNVESKYMTGENDEFATVYTLNDLLRYKHCSLVLYPPEDESSFGDFVLEIDLKHTKGGLGEGKES
jgi:hypothetical protein